MHFYPLKLKCETKQIYNEELQYCRYALANKSSFSRRKNTYLFSADPNNCHIIMTSIVSRFEVKYANCDANVIVQPKKRVTTVIHHPDLCVSRVN